MNDQQLQQIFSLQQALATAAAAAVINNLMNPQQQQPNTPQNNNSNPALASQVAAMLAASANQPAQLNGDLTQQLISAAAANNVNDQGSQLQLHQQQQQLLQLQNTLNQLTEQQNRLNPATNQINLANSRSNSNSPSSNPAKSVGALSPPLISSHQHQPDLNSNPNQLHNLLMQLQQQAALQQSQTPAQLQQLSQSPLAALQGLNGLNGLGGQNASLASSPQSLLSALSGFVNPPAPAHQLHQNLNLNLNHHSSSPVRSPNIVHNNGRQSHNAEHKNTSNNTQSALKKVKRHHAPQQQSIPNHQLTDATSKPQAALLSQPGKNVHSSGQLSGASHLLNNRNSTSTNNSGSSSSATFSNLPRKLVRGQDVWLGRGAEQTRQILKCMWCGQSFKSLAEMTEHMKLTQHYTNIISQEQITSWRHPDTGETKRSNSKTQKNSGPLGKLDSSSDIYNDSDQEEMFSGDEGSVVSAIKNHISDDTNQDSRLIIKQDSPDEANIGSDREDSRNGIIANNDTPPATPNMKSSKICKQSDNQLKLKSDQQNNKHHEDQPKMKGNEKSTKSSNGADSKLTTKLDEPNSIDADDLKNVIKGIMDSEEDVVGKKRKQLNSSDEGKITPLNCEEGRQQRQSESDSDSNAENEIDDRSNGYDYDNEGKSDSREASSDIDRISNDSTIKAQADHQRNLFAQAENKLAQMAKSAQAQLRQAPQTDDPGNPLSALESMVETNVNSSGGILQRLGIDEEVGPPWQHINYANWCAAAYGNPMAAALLAAGLNFQNGLRLTKNLRKNDD